MSMDEHDIEWRCGCGHTNPDFNEKCAGCGAERYPNESASADDTWELLSKAYTKIGSLEDFEEAKKDRARLDWMIEKGAKVDESNGAAEDGEPWMCRHRTFHTSFQGEVHYIYGASARDAIDKAMARRET